MSKRFYEVSHKQSLGDVLNHLVAECAYYVVVDQRVFRLHEARLADFLANSACLGSYRLAASEAQKDLSKVAAICDHMLARNVKRSDYVIAIGGGITSDIAALAAALTKRGIGLIIVPTTLLAMVDAAIGGKAGVNSRHGKNSLGTFYEAQHIVFDRLFLSSLPADEWENGRAECLKYSYLSRQFKDCAVRADCADFKAKVGADIMRYAAYKQQLCAADLHDVGLRQVLNFGHTFGHALEMVMQLAHGKAVMLGLAVSLFISERHYNAAVGADDYMKWLVAQNWYQTIAWPTFAELEYYLLRDKKNGAARVRMVLLAERGDPQIVELSLAKLQQFYRGCRDVLASLSS